MDLDLLSIITDMNYMSSPSTLISLLGCLVTFFLLAIRWSKKKPVGPAPPPEPKGSLPLLGHLQLLGGPELPHQVFSKLADEYGPIFKIRFGYRQAIVVNNSETAKECLQENDREFINIPNMQAYKYLMYDGATFPITPVGPFWREMRKMSNLQLLSNHRLADVEHIWMSTVRADVRGLYDKWVLENPAGKTITKDVIFEMKEWVENVSLMTIVELVVGKSFFMKEDKLRLMKILEEYFHLSSIVTMADAIPILSWFDIGGYEKRMAKAGKEMDALLQDWLERHKSYRKINGAEKKQSWMDTLIDVYEAEDVKMFDYDAETLIKATSQAMILGAADNISVVVIWVLCLILNHPETLKKVQEELDIHVGRERKLEKSDINNLVYLNAIINETFRLHPPGPLLVPRESIADTIIGGYHVPAGTMLFINAYKIQRDPLLWDDPCVFRPERFLTTHKHIDPKGRHFELIPFSSGRRGCTGTSYALQVISFILASLLHNFEITTVSDKPVDMTEKHGLTVSKATPLEVILTPRLPHHVYEIVK